MLKRVICNSVAKGHGAKIPIFRMAGNQAINRPFGLVQYRSMTHAQRMRLESMTDSESEDDISDDNVSSDDISSDAEFEDSTAKRDLGKIQNLMSEVRNR